MFNNGMNNGFRGGNVAGMPNRPNNVAGINKTPSNISGLNKMPTRQDPFANIKIDRQRSKQIMNSSGENVIRNNVNRGGFNGN